MKNTNKKVLNKLKTLGGNNSARKGLLARGRKRFLHSHFIEKAVVYFLTVSLLFGIAGYAAFSFAADGDAEPCTVHGMIDCDYPECTDKAPDPDEFDCEDCEDAGCEACEKQIFAKCDCVDDEDCDVCRYPVFTKCDCEYGEDCDVCFDCEDCDDVDCLVCNPVQSDVCIDCGYCDICDEEHECGDCADCDTENTSGGNKHVDPGSDFANIKNPDGDDDIGFEPTMLMLLSGPCDDGDCGEKDCTKCYPPLPTNRAVRITSMQLTHWPRVDGGGDRLPVTVDPGHASAMVMRNGDTLDMRFNWEVAVPSAGTPTTWSREGIQVVNGDTWDVELWNNAAVQMPINFGNNVRGTIYDHNYVPIGTMTLNPTGSPGIMRMTFNNVGADGMFGVRGDIRITTYIIYNDSTRQDTTVSFTDANYTFSFLFERADTGEGTGISLRLRNENDEPPRDHRGGIGNIQEIYWEADVNTQLRATPGANYVTITLTQASLPPTATYAGHYLPTDLSLIKVYPLEVNLGNGEVYRSNTPLSQGTDYTITFSNPMDTGNRTMTITFTNASLSRNAYRIEFSTIPVNPAHPTHNIRYTSTASLGAANSTATFFNSANFVSADAEHEKTGRLTLATNDNDASIAWTIRANIFGKELKAGTTTGTPLHQSGTAFQITDTLGAGQEFPDNTEIKVTPQRVTHPTFANMAITYANVSTAIILRLPDKDTDPPFVSGGYRLFRTADNAFRLEIPATALRNTTHSAPVEPHHAFLITFSVDLNNPQNTWNNYVTCNSQAPNCTGVVTTGVAGVGGPVAPTVAKTHLSTNVGRGVIRWQVDINPMRNQLTNITIKETFRAANLSTPTAPNPLLSMSLATDEEFLVSVGGGSALVNDPANPYYNIVEEDPPSDGFTLTFTDRFYNEFGSAGNNTLRSSQIRLVYYTKYNMGASNVYGFYNNGEAIRYTNSVQVSAGNWGNNATVRAINATPISRSVDISATHTRNAAKSGRYDTGYFEWTIEFNHLDSSRKQILGPVVLQDRWDREQQSFVNGSLRVYMGVPGGSGTALPGSTDLPLVPASAYTFNLRTEGDGFQLSFPNNAVTGKLVVIYRTQRIGALLPSYVNDLWIGGNEIAGSVFNPTATPPLVKATAIAPSGRHASKAGVTAEDNRINWTVRINESQYIVRNAQVRDVIGKGQTLVSPHNIAVYRGTIRLTEGVHYRFPALHPYFNPLDGTTTIIIDFIGEMPGVVHTITYTTEVDNDRIERDEAGGGRYYVLNSLSFTGNAGHINTSVVPVRVDSSWTLISGRGSGVQIPLYIAKRSSEPSREFLVGARFDLLDANGRLLLSGIEVNERGIMRVTFGDEDETGVDLPAGTYQLRETRAPTGFIQRTTPLRFTITAAHVTHGQRIVEVFNDPIRPPEQNPIPVRVTVRERGTTPNVPGAVYIIENEDGTPIPGVTVPVTSTEELERLIATLGPGRYRVRLIGVPDGYVLAPGETDVRPVIITDTTPPTGITIIFELVPVPEDPDDPPPPPIVPPPPPPVVPPPPPPPVDPPPPPPPLPPLISLGEELDIEDEDPVQADFDDVPHDDDPSTNAIIAAPTDTDASGGIPQTEEERMQEMFDAQTGNIFTDLLDGNIPLGNFGLGGVAWSLLNLLMSMLALLNAIVLMVTLFFRRRKNKEYEEDDYTEADAAETDEEEKEEKGFRHRLMKLRVPALLAGIIPGILFLLLENIRLPIVWITRWTPLIGAFFILHMVLLLVFLAIKRENKPEDEDKDKGETESFGAAPSASIGQ